MECGGSRLPMESKAVVALGEGLQAPLVGLDLLQQLLVAIVAAWCRDEQRSKNERERRRKCTHRRTMCDANPCRCGSRSSSCPSFGGTAAAVLPLPLPLPPPAIGTKFRDISKK
jgi:hypothetical protein